MFRSLTREQNLNDEQVAEICRRYLDDPEDIKRCKSVIKGLINDSDATKEELK